MMLDQAGGVTALLEDNATVGEPRAGARRFWTTTELAIMRRVYPTQGVAGAMAALPGRSAGAIYQRAGIMALRAPATIARWQAGQTVRHRWAGSEHIDAVIRRRYPGCIKRLDVARLAQSLNRPRWWVSKRAAALGLVAPRFKEPDWSAAELEIVHTGAHLQPAVLRRRLAKAGYRRTETAIIVKLKRIGADRTDPNNTTAHALSRLMGVDGHTVTDWIAKGWLPAKPRGTDRVAAQGGDQWWISYAAVRTFIITHTTHVDIRKVDKFWFVELLANPP